MSVSLHLQLKPGLTGRAAATKFVSQRQLWADHEVLPG